MATFNEISALIKTKAHQSRFVELKTSLYGDEDKPFEEFFKALPDPDCRISGMSLLMTLGMPATATWRLVCVCVTVRSWMGPRVSGGGGGRGRGGGGSGVCATDGVAHEVVAAGVWRP